MHPMVPFAAGMRRERHIDDPLLPGRNCARGTRRRPPRPDYGDDGAPGCFPFLLFLVEPKALCCLLAGAHAPVLWLAGAVQRVLVWRPAGLAGC